MTTKTTATKTRQARAKVEPVKPGIEISGCTVSNTVNAQANQHTRAAVEALANAVAENARALAAIADVLKPAPAHFGAGIHLEGPLHG